MTAVTSAIGMLREVLMLTTEVKSIGQLAKDLGVEVRGLDRRVTRLEAQWETAIALSGRGRSKPDGPAAAAPRRLPGPRRKPRDDGDGVGS